MKPTTPTKAELRERFESEREITRMLSRHFDAACKALGLDSEAVFEDGSLLESSPVLKDVASLRTRLAEVERERDEAIGRGMAAAFQRANQKVLADELRARAERAEAALSQSREREAGLRRALVKAEDNLACYFAADGAHANDFRLRRAEEAIRTALETEPAVTFCACGRRVGECDGSRKGCGR